MRHLTLLALSFLVVLSAVACEGGGSTPPGLVVPTVSKYTTMPSTSDMLAEKIIGNAAAPTTIYEYVSFWCPNCPTFHTTVELQMKSQFVDTGIAKIYFRNLFTPSELQSNASGYPSAAMLARCVGNTDFFSAVDYIFLNQSQWLPNGDAGIRSTMLAFGMSQPLEDQCMSNAALANGLGQIHDAALTATYQLPDGTTAVGLTHVPAVVVNGVKLDSTTNADGTTNPANAPTIDNIAKLVNGK